MTEQRLIESAVGSAGRLSHTPYGIDRPEDCGWRSSRNFARNAPVFRALGTSITWIPARRDHAASSLPPPGSLWEQSRRQQGWLMRNHPEASLGNHLLHDQLAEEKAVLSSEQQHGRNTCLFSLGEMTDTTMQRNPGILLIVTVTGSANNILRFARLEQPKWLWSREPHVAVRLAEVAAEKPEMWIEEEVGPIHRVKCMVDLQRYNPTRWLAVQRDSGTTIFQPEYRKAGQDASLERDFPYIAPNPRFHLSKKQTGGNTPSDVSFNPGTRSNPPQLAIIDEGGFWSVWDVRYTRLKPLSRSSPKLRVCGHIDRGVLERLPQRDHSDTSWHTVLWIGHSENNLDLLGSLDLGADNEELGSEPAFPPLQRSSSLLLCNSQQVRLLDLTTGVFLPDLVFCHPDSLECILDVQIAHNSQYCYVLTTSQLFIVRAYSRSGAAWDKPEKLWSILFSTPHFRSSFDRSLKIVVSQSDKPDQTTSLVFVHSSTNPWIDLFYVEFSKTNPNEVRCQANVNGLGSLQNDALHSAIRTLCIAPAPVIAKASESLSKVGLDLAEKQVRLYQVVALQSDLSLISTPCVFSFSSPIQISVPDIRVGPRLRAVYRGRYLEHLASRFVKADDSATSDEDPPSVAHRYVKAFYEHLSSISSTHDKDAPDDSAERRVSVHNPFDAVYQGVQKGLDGGFLPVRTLLQAMPVLTEALRRSLLATEWESEIRELNNIHPSVAVYTLDLPRSRLRFSLSTSMQETYLRLHEIATNSLHHEDGHDANERRMAAISEQIAYDLHLSLHGIGYHNVSSNQPEAIVDDDVLLNSQTETLPSSPPRPESPTSTAWSQRSNSEAAVPEDPAMTLLRAYTGTGKYVPEKKLELLDKWKLGSEPSDYVFDLDRTGDADAGQARKAKKLARDDRKRRRAQTLLQPSQEPELPAPQPVSQPPPDISFFSSQSRAMSSQRPVLHSDPLHMMSQPSEGLFGRRPHKKLKKRKGGF
ncbi:RNA polymerase I-specific transcription initiation factor RRN6-like protein [Nemania sp. NC0429]|nr:RNA polymerase I-specific transcription initiation factor RRN6-like protein [Nemania sp. NC0429]